MARARSVIVLLVIQTLAFAGVSSFGQGRDAGPSNYSPFASQQLTWSASGAVGTFDLYLGMSNPPRLAVTGITGNSYTADNLMPATTYYWYVVAHASCDATRTSRGAIKSFTTAGACSPAGQFNLHSPIDQEGGVALSPTLSWAGSSGAVAYDVYLGTSSSPPLYLSDVSASSLSVRGLSPLTKYYWRVVAKAACDPTKSATSSTRSFTVGSSCGTPATPTILSIPSSIGSGQTYAVSWSDSTNLDPSGSYVIERAPDTGFSAIIDRQQTTSTAASFVGAPAGTVYHRVRAVSGCPGGGTSVNSSSKFVGVNPATPSVVFTIQPRPIVTKLGDKLEDLRGGFTMENLGDQTVQVIVGAQNVNGSLPFFQIFDPFGGSGQFVTLEPHKPKNMGIQFSGPPNDQAGTYEGMIYLVSTGEQFAVNPLVYVNLKIGGDAAAAAPKFLVNGVESEYAWFPPFEGDDASRPAVSVDILNSGTVPMEVAGEIGPELWLRIDKDWNKTAVGPSAFRAIRLSTQRNRAPNGSALPRYTYLTIRNKAGQSARLLVADNGGATVGTGRATAPESSERSFVIPFVTSQTSQSGAKTISRLRLTNTGAEVVQAELVFTPADKDGFDASSVKRVTIVVPPNDVANLTDPLAQIFGYTTNQSGTLEVRAPQEKIGFLMVTSTTHRLVAGGGSYGASVPVVERGAGARLGASQIIVGVRSVTDTKTSLLLAETTGREKTSVRVTLYDAQGNARGNQLVEVPRHGVKQIADIAQALGGGAAFETGRIDLAVENGGGAVIGVAAVGDPSTENAAMLASRDADANTAPSPLGRPGLDAAARVMNATGAITYVIPGVVNGEVPLAGEPAATSRTRLALTGATDAATSFKLTFTDKSGQTYVQNASVPAKQTVEYANVLEELFKLTAGTKTEGWLKIETDSRGHAAARVTAKLSKGTVGDALPTLTPFADALTGGGSAKPLYADGIEQSTDATKGTRSSLTLTEVGGRAATVILYVYEAGNRTLPIATKVVVLGASQQLTIESLFASMSLDGEDRKKDRTNVAVVATVTTGSGLVSALLTTIDNGTGETRKTSMLPSGGVPGTDGSVSSTPGGTRKRPIRR